MPRSDEPFVPVPERGRRFTATRRVRWGDADRRGHLRLDSLARYLQDVANDDSRDAGLDPSSPWVVRRTAMEHVVAPTVGETLTLVTFSGGLGGRWAERRTSITGSRRASVETAAIWVFLDPVSGRPARLTDEFLGLYAEASGGRRVRAHLTHDGPPADADRRMWPLRSTDLDQMGHMNNAATWEPIEDELARREVAPGRAELEYGDAIDPGDEVELRSTVAADGTVSMWLCVADAVRASAVVHPHGAGVRPVAVPATDQPLTSPAPS